MIKKSSESGIVNEPNFQFANELHKPIIRKFKKRGVDLADVQSLSKYNKGSKYLLRAIDLLSKYARVVPLKDEEGSSIVNAFQKIISKENKIKYGLIKVVNFI